MAPVQPRSHEPRRHRHRHRLDRARHYAGTRGGGIFDVSRLTPTLGRSPALRDTACRQCLWLFAHPRDAPGDECTLSAVGWLKRHS